jgi:DNA-binding CsgD family transcriptional regulator
MNTELSRSDVNLMLDIIHSSLKCTDVFGFEKLLEQLKTLISFSCVRCGFGDCNEFATKKMDAFKMIATFPQEWETRYAQKNYVFKDAVALVAFQKKGLIYWSDCLQAEGKEKTEYAEQKQIMDEAASIGLKKGWIFSLQGRRSSECAIISLAGEKVNKDKRSEKILTHLGPHIGQVIKKIILNQTNAPAKLTPREYEILSWAAAGKTAWETSQILNISQRTVEFHMGNILNKLDAVNSQQAIAIAVFNGLIAY